MTVILPISACIVNPDWTRVGIFVNCNLFNRWIFHFFHASAFHAIINSWCLLAVVFSCNLSLRHFFTAYFIAALAPDIVLSHIPTVGLSAICYALFGLLTWQVRNKLHFASCSLIYIAAGLAANLILPAPAVNVYIHLYSYLAGLVVGLLDLPLQCSRK